VTAFLSVDWDFFIYNGAHEPQRIRGDGDTWVMAPGALVYDWGHSEGHGASISEMLWTIRHQGFQRMGIDLEAATAIRTDLDTFVDEVTAPGRPLFQMYADSHAWAGLVARDLSAHGEIPFDVVSFDAHHDLGYHHKRGSDKLDAGNWLAQALDHGWASTATVVYPDWLHELHWDKKAWGDKVTVMSWTEWLAQPDRPKFHAGFLCRSSAWTPPWHDKQFTALRHLLLPLGICLDENQDVKLGAYNAKEERQWTSPGPATFAETTDPTG
jgi:hypothetical protein